MVRKSARSRKETRYAVNDVYKDLDSDTAPAPEGDEDNVSSSDDDFRIPDAGEAGEKTGGGDEGEEEEEDDSEGVVSEEEEESEEESDDDVVGGGEDDESDDDDDRPRRPKSKGSAVGASAGKNKAPGATTSFRARQRREDETPGSAPSVHKKHVRTVTSGKLVGRKKMIAEGASASELKVPDPAIRITYRPGISKATGKKDRIMQVYGGADDAHEKAMRARNMWMDLPTLPERGGEASPFLEGREGGEEEPRLGEGGQVSRPLEFESVAAYMAKVAEPLKLVVGHVGAYEKVTFKRFEIYDLRKVAEDKRGFLVNAGAQVLSMDWATNRPEGIAVLVSTVYIRWLTILYVKAVSISPFQLLQKEKRPAR